MSNFILVLGSENAVLPGKLWTQYDVEILDNKMVCTQKKDESVKVEVPFSTIKATEFGIGSGNLWLALSFGETKLIFASPRKCWKSEEGKKLIEKINAVAEIKDMKEYQHYTGKLFFINNHREYSILYRLEMNRIF